MSDVLEYFAAFAMAGAGLAVMLLTAIIVLSLAVAIANGIRRAVDRFKIAKPTEALYRREVKARKEKLRVLKHE